MSTSWTINIRDKASPEVRRRIANCRPARLNAFVGPAVSKLVKGHFISRPHNRRGFPTTNFYAGAARSTNWQVAPDGVIISVNQIGVRQRYHGGEIRPVNAKFLTIPVAAEAYGKTAADFGDRLQLVVIKGKGAWLALKSFEPRDRDKQHGRRQRQGPGQSIQRERLKFLFMLCAGVTQDADPDVLPTDDEIMQTVETASLEAIK